MQIILKYFPNLTDHQIAQFKALGELYEHWNSQINVISRKDIEHLYERHILHSLAIAKYISFRPGTKIMDVGTGGGFPGLPLAIMFPECSFLLVDSIGKKLKVIDEVALAIGLNNIETEHERAENIEDKFDFVVSRAVTRMADFYPWVQDKFRKESKNSVSNGILYLKGLDLKDEIKEFRRSIQQTPLKQYFDEAFFEEKALWYVMV